MDETSALISAIYTLTEAVSDLKLSFEEMSCRLETVEKIEKVERIQKELTAKGLKTIQKKLEDHELFDVVR